MRKNETREALLIIGNYYYFSEEVKKSKNMSTVDSQLSAVPGLERRADTKNGG